MLDKLQKQESKLPLEGRYQDLPQARRGCFDSQVGAPNSVFDHLPRYSAGFGFVLLTKSTMGMTSEKVRLMSLNIDFKTNAFRNLPGIDLP